MSDARSADLARVVAYFEALQRSDLDRLASIYADDARFEDPFNEVTGLAAIRRVFEHMFEQVAQPRFHIHDAVAHGDSAFITWTFRFLPRGRARPFEIRGATHLRFGADGRIALHRDYWDAAGELYGKLPLVGALMRWLRRRVSATDRPS